MPEPFNLIAKSVRYTRIQRDIQQAQAAEESGISLRTLQNIEAGKAVSSSALVKYLSYLQLLDAMLATLPNPEELTPMERLANQPKRRERVRVKMEDSAHSKGFSWGDES